MLEQDRFLAMKKLAKEVRKENEDTFKSFENESVEEAIREKEEFIESIIDSMDISFSEGDKGKEEKQIFRANVLIPDDVDFFESYSKDKNIRNLMNKYAVSIEDIMSKITELNIYSKYIETFNEPKEDFVDDMVNMSTKEAENLLDEIEDLSNTMEDINVIEKEQPKEEKSFDNSLTEPFGFEYNTTTEPEIKVEKEEASEPQVEITDEIENISTAVSDFVDEYTKVKKELDFTQAKINKFNTEKEELRKQLTSINEDKENLLKQTEEMKKELEILREKESKMTEENKTLKSKVEVMEKNAKQSTDLLKQIYQSIPKKRFNVKEG